MRQANRMPNFSYQKAKDQIKPREMERLVCMFLTHFDQIKVKRFVYSFRTHLTNFLL
jgi:hypothetical protein